MLLRIYTAVLVLTMSSLSHAKAAEPQLLKLDAIESSVVKAGFGSFDEQIQALRSVKILQSSPGALLEHIAKCRLEPDADDGCKDLVGQVRNVLDEYGAQRERTNVDNLIARMGQAAPSPVESEGAHLPLDAPVAFGSFHEQVKSLQIVNALRESPGNLLQQLSKCSGKSEPLSVKQRHFCAPLLRGAHTLLRDASLTRPQLSVDALMRAISDAMTASPGDRVATKDEEIHRSH